MKPFSTVPGVSLLAVCLLLLLTAFSACHADKKKGEQGTSQHTSCTDTLTLVFTGDIMLDRGVRRVIEKQGVDGLFTETVDSLLHASKVVVGNLECPATKIEAPVQKLFIFRGEPEWLQALHDHGFTHLNLANNHSIDQGRRGLTDTRQNIIDAGMVPVGAGKNLSEACEPVLLADSPRPVWLFCSLRLALENFAYLEDRPTVAQQSLDTLRAQVARLRTDDPRAVIIVSLHWGGEHRLEPSPSQCLDAHRLIDAGADALICHHTHTLQTIEHYRLRPIYYSIGNFIFDSNKPLNSRACMVKLTITADSVRTETIPVTINRCKPEITR